MTLPWTDLAWAAGLFEGEGTVRINKPSRRNTGALLASVVNTDRQVSEWFQTRWPGFMKRATGLDPSRQRPAWVWVVAARRAVAFLSAIRPFVVRDLVRARIDHGLAFQAEKSASPLVNRSVAYAEQQWIAYWWMRELNARGVEVACPNAGEWRKPR